jgi:hypothetical protein
LRLNDEVGEIVVKKIIDCNAGLFIWKRLAIPNRPKDRLETSLSTSVSLDLL